MKSYGKLCTIIYDLDKPYANNEELNLYIKALENKSSTILEPMCGSGRFYIPLLKKGYNITGFDLSEEMLKACNKKCKELLLTPNIYKEDITTFNSVKKFDYVFIPIGSVSLLIDNNDLVAGLRNIYSVLNKNGKFIFSFLNDKAKEEDIFDWKESMRYKYDGMDIICKMKQQVNNEIGLIDMKLLYELRDNNKLIEEEYQDFPMRLFNENKITEYLKEVGFTSIEKINNEDVDNVFSVFSCIKDR